MLPHFLDEPIEAIVFDCDGTLSHIEGIDELARSKQVVARVAQLTAIAMGTTDLTPQLYAQRLALVDPTEDAVSNLAQDYFVHRAPDSQAVVQQLLALGKALYIVSAGLYPAVVGFGERLNIPRENIYAVKVYFDLQGRYYDFDQVSPLVQPGGKRVIVKTLQQKHAKVLYVGDGMSDYVVYDLVDRFVGYGGAFCRENLAQRCPYYLASASFKELLPFCLTQQEWSEHYA